MCATCPSNPLHNVVHSCCEQIKLSRRLAFTVKRVSIVLSVKTEGVSRHGHLRLLRCS
jgi:hypothetical protein